MKIEGNSSTDIAYCHQLMLYLNNRAKFSALVIRCFVGGQNNPSTHAQMADLETLFFHHKSKSTTHKRMFVNIFCLYHYSVTQGSHAPCAKARASARCAAAPEGLPVTFMFSSACEGKRYHRCKMISGVCLLKDILLLGL